MTRSIEKIDKELSVLVKCEKYVIAFKENNNPWFDNMVSNNLKQPMKGINHTEGVMEGVGEASRIINSSEML